VAAHPRGNREAMGRRATQDEKVATPVTSCNDHERAASASARRHALGIDVGTGSVRAGLLHDSGRMLASAKADISLHRAAGLLVEQSSAEIRRVQFGLG